MRGGARARRPGGSPRRRGSLGRSELRPPIPPRGGGARACDPRRLARSAAALRAAPRGRAVPHAGAALPRPHRPRGGTRAGERPAHRAGCCGRALRRTGSRTTRDSSRTCARSCATRRPPVIPGAGSTRCRSGRASPSSGCRARATRAGLLAAHIGAAFSFARFINAHGGAEVAAAPRSSVAVFAVCAETEEEARRLARGRDLFIVRLYTGRPGPYPSVERRWPIPTLRRSWPSRSTRASAAWWARRTR